MVHLGHAGTRPETARRFGSLYAGGQTASADAEQVRVLCAVETGREHRERMLALGSIPYIVIPVALGRGVHLELENQPICELLAPRTQGVIARYRQECISY